MSEFISVPRAFVDKHLYSSAFPVRAHVYGPIKHAYVNTSFSTYGFNGFKFVCTYKRLPKNWYDKLMGRTRYELVHVHNEILGSQGTYNITSEQRKNMADWENIDHLDIRYRGYRTWNA